MRSRTNKPRGLSELARQDWEARIDKLTDLAGKKLVEYKIVDGKVAGVVPVQAVFDSAAKKGLEAFQQDDILIVAVLQKTA